jgi:hypothetical protein
VYLTGADIIDMVGQLNYRYDDDPLMLSRQFQRPLATRGFAEARPSAVAVQPEAPRVEPVQTLAASAPSTTELDGTTVRVQVPLTEAASNRMQALVANNAPRQVFLRLDGIRYDKSSGVYYEVYVNPPAGEKLDIHTLCYVGNLSLFALKPHAMPGHQPPPARDVCVEYDISHLAREAMAGQSEGAHHRASPARPVRRARGTAAGAGRGARHGGQRAHHQPLSVA